MIKILKNASFYFWKLTYSVVTSFMNAIGICFNISTLFLLYGYFWYLLEIQFTVHYIFYFVCVRVTCYLCESLNIFLLLCILCVWRGVHMTPVCLRGIKHLKRRTMLPEALDTELLLRNSMTWFIYFKS